jgi:hypothetical protein
MSLREPDNLEALVEVARQVLARAAAKVWGVEALASRSILRHRLLYHYIEGKHAVPDVVFLRAVDVMLEDVPNRIPLSQQDEQSFPGFKPDQ